MPITAQQLAQAMRVDYADAQLAAEVDRLLASTRVMVERHAPDAPDAILVEAQVRLAGYLFDAPAGVESGPVRSPMLHSGAAALLAVYRTRRAGGAAAGTSGTAAGGPGVDAQARAEAAAALAEAEANTSFLSTFAARVAALIVAAVPAWARAPNPPAPSDLPPHEQVQETGLFSRAGNLFWRIVREVPTTPGEQSGIGHVLTVTGENDRDYAWRPNAGGDPGGVDAQARAAAATNARNITALDGTVTPLRQSFAALETALPDPPVPAAAAQGVTYGLQLPAVGSQSVRALWVALAGGMVSNVADWAVKDDTDGVPFEKLRPFLFETHNLVRELSDAAAIDFDFQPNPNGATKSLAHGFTVPADAFNGVDRIYLEFGCRLHFSNPSSAIATVELTVSYGLIPVLASFPLEPDAVFRTLFVEFPREKLAGESPTNPFNFHVRVVSTNREVGSVLFKRIRVFPGDAPAAPYVRNIMLPSLDAAAAARAALAARIARFELPAPKLEPDYWLNSEAAHTVVVHLDASIVNAEGVGAIGINIKGIPKSAARAQDQTSYAFEFSAQDAKNIKQNLSGATTIPYEVVTAESSSSAAPIYRNKGVLRVLDAAPAGGGIPPFGAAFLVTETGGTSAAGGSDDASNGFQLVRSRQHDGNKRVHPEYVIPADVNQLVVCPGTHGGGGLLFDVAALPVVAAGAAASFHAEYPVMEFSRSTPRILATYSLAKTADRRLLMNIKFISDISFRNVRFQVFPVGGA